MNDIVNQIKQSYKTGDILTRLIFVNVGIYLCMVAFRTIFGLFTTVSVRQFDDTVVEYLGAPYNDFTQLIYKFYTIITHMFLHIEFYHILSNMILLYFLGRIFLSYFTPKRLLGLYFLGGLMGITLLEVILAISPNFPNSSYAYGASAAVTAIVLGICLHAPKVEVRIFGIIPVKLLWLGIGIVLLDFIRMMDGNTGGHIAHIGGALAGYLFASAEKQGKDITKIINSVISSIVNLFKHKSKMKVVYSQENVKNMTDDEYNKNKVYTQKEIDKILDKISASGYESLTKKEKKDLYNFSKNK